MLTAAELTRARYDLAQLLPDRATIQRPTTASDGGGGYTQTLATLAANVPCRLSPVGGGEDTAGGGERINDASTAVITFGHGQDVTESDMIVISGQTFDVQLVRRRGVFEMTRRCEAREV